MSERLEEIRGRQRLRHGGSQIAFGDIGYLLVRLDKAEAERDALRADLREARELLRGAQPMIGTDNVRVAKVRTMEASIYAFLTRTAPRTIQQQVSDSPTASREEGETR